MSVEISFQNSVTEEQKRFIEEGFSEHAISMTGADGDMRPIVFTASTDGTLTGMVVAKTFWGGLHIKNLYVASNGRGKGIGLQLIEQACEKGKEYGCRFAFVETMSFQALDFYRKAGFELEYTRSGYDKGVDFHYLKRDF